MEIIGIFVGGLSLGLGCCWVCYSVASVGYHVGKGIEES